MKRPNPYMEVKNLEKRKQTALFYFTFYYILLFVSPGIYIKVQIKKLETVLIFGQDHNAWMRVACDVNFKLIKA